MTKTLLRPEMKLQLGDFLLEGNRFDLKKKYIIWEIVEIGKEEDWMRIQVVESGINGYAKIGYTCGAQISAHCVHKNCTEVTYLLSNYLPVGKILYGPLPKNNIPHT